MNDLLQKLDDMPVTTAIAIAYGTLFVLTAPFRPEGFIERLHDYGMLRGLDCAAGEPWRLIAYAFLHGNIVHLLFNLAMLLSVGPALERTLGSMRLLLLYVVGAIGGGLLVCLVNEPGQAVVGGSGALFGMLGTALAINMRSGRHLLAFLDFEGPRRLVGMIVANLLIGYFLPFISNSGHIGGLIAGFALTFLWLRPGPASPQRAHWRAAMAALFAAALFAAVQPVTRADAIERELQSTSDPERREQLARAWLRVIAGRPEVPAAASEPARRR
jgi:membrane associated rhomboid family serine protease